MNTKVVSSQSLSVFHDDIKAEYGQGLSECQPQCKQLGLGLQACGELVIE